MTINTAIMEISLEVPQKFKVELHVIQFHHIWTYTQRILYPAIIIQ